MPSLDWSVFKSLPGAVTSNFENLCRAIVRIHYGGFGEFIAYKNHPGVEFELELNRDCPSLGQNTKWFGWQCKVFEPDTNGHLRSASKTKILESLKKTEKHSPHITDWVLWTPFTLSKKDQKWFRGISCGFSLHLNDLEDVDALLSGPAIYLRDTYFGDRVLTPEDLQQHHLQSVLPIKERWLHSVHQEIPQELELRQILCEPSSWQSLKIKATRLQSLLEVFEKHPNALSNKLEAPAKAFIRACQHCIDVSNNLYSSLLDGDLKGAEHYSSNYKSEISLSAYSYPQKLRSRNFSVALEVTNGLDDLYLGQELINGINAKLKMSFVAVLAEAGGGKTQLAASLTANQRNRPAGILLHGKNLHRGQSLDHLAQSFVLHGNPFSSMESLVAALDSAAARSYCRLPLVIDGLNEAENPKDWKFPLAILQAWIHKYPNVLFVCTLRTGERKRRSHHLAHDDVNSRETFAEKSLPSDYERIELRGFGKQTSEAIEKYFTFYKIDAERSSLPQGFLSHPLTLRIFCDATNPQRKEVIRISYFPTSLAQIFEKYLNHAAKRIEDMGNLRYSYDSNEVLQAIFKLGLLLLKSGTREVLEATFREKIKDESREWNSSLVNLLAQEGVIFRNPGEDSESYVLTPNYDALGGFIIASAIVKKQNSATKLRNWFAKKKTKKLFIGEYSHHLSFDTFRSLVALVPMKIYGAQLWHLVPDYLKNQALRITPELPLELIDSRTVEELERLIVDEKVDFAKCFTNLSYYRSEETHPLNVNFIDRVLTKLPVYKRDILWTEWLRTSHREIVDDIENLEAHWKANPSRSSKDTLTARWVGWYLTSSSHELRDKATKALYWFGREAPSELFSLTLGCLAHNDVYVPERMLAASYGVSMSLYAESEQLKVHQASFKSFSEELFRVVFANDSEIVTIHQLLLEYTRGIIEVSLKLDVLTLTPEQQGLTSPPYSHLASKICWGTPSEGFADQDSESPFRMDFENYTLGRLVPGRGNYNYEHDGYKDVRRKILWRVETLGWTAERFEDIDSLVTSEQYHSRMGSEQHKTDRYGKKYSWIAYHEMAGYLKSLEEIDGAEERTSSVDIDPSFPLTINNSKFYSGTLLGTSAVSTIQWIADPEPSDLSSLLTPLSLESYECDDWVVLDGYLAQVNKLDGRSSFAFVRALLVREEETESFIELLSGQELGNRWLPENPQFYYTFAGEVPWSYAYPSLEKEEISFEIASSKQVVKGVELILQFDGKDYAICHQSGSWVAFQNQNQNQLDTEILKDLSEDNMSRISFIEKEMELEKDVVEYKKIDVLLPVCELSWEGHQSCTSEAHNACALSKDICESLNLVMKPQSLDMFDRNGEQVTLNVSDHSHSFSNKQSGFFMRRKYLDDYLTKNGLNMIWVVWGERSFDNETLQALVDEGERPDIPYKVFSTVKAHTRSH